MCRKSALINVFRLIFVIVSKHDLDLLHRVNKGESIKMSQRNPHNHLSQPYTSSLWQRAKKIFWQPIRIKQHENM